MELPFRTGPRLVTTIPPVVSIMLLFTILTANSRLLKQILNIL